MLPGVTPAASRLRLPASAARRGAPSYVKLVCAVRHHWGEYNFDGEVYRPGETVAGAALPAVRPLLAIECAGSAHAGWGHRRSLYVHILWKWDPHLGEWCELARAMAVGADWSASLGPIAEAELAHHKAPLLIDPQGSARRILAAVEQEIAGIDRKARRLVLSAVYDQVAARVVEG